MPTHRRPGRSAGRRGSGAVRPRLTGLEDRLVPTVFNIANGDIAAFRAAVAGATHRQD